MSLISAFDIVSFLAILTAFCLLLKGWRRDLNRDARLLFAGFLLLLLFYSIGNVLEWTGISNVLGPYEEYAAILVPVLLVFFFYTFLQKKSEEAFRISEEKFRSFTEASPAGVFATDVEGNHIFWNERLCDITGVSFSEVKGQGWAQCVHPEDRDWVFTKWYEAVKMKMNFQMEHRYIRSDDTVIWGFVQALPVKNPQGHVTGYIGTVTDITDRKQAEQALKKSKELLEKMFLSLDSAVFVLDNKNPPVILDSNPSASRIFGYRKDEILNRTTEFLHISKEKLLEFQKVLYPAIEDKGFLSFFEFGMKRKNGEIFPTEHSVLPLKDDEGNNIGWISVIRDITNRKKAEEALLESENSYRAVVENAAEGIVVVQGQTLQFVNPAVVSMTGYSEKEMLIRSFIEFVHPDHREWAMEIHIKRLKGEEVPSVYEIKILDNKGNVKWMENSGILIEWRDKPATLNFLRDITDRKRAEEALKESEEKFRSLAEQSPNMIFINKKGKIVYANKKCEEVMGYKRHEFYSPDFDFLKLIAPESRDLIKKNFARHLKGKEVPPYEYTLINKAGERIEAINTSRLIQYEGMPTIIGIVTDITERKRAERALREREETLMSIFRASPIGIGLVSNRVLLQVNNKICEMLGYSSDELVGKNARILYPSDEDYEYVGREKYRQISEHGTGTVETRWQCKDGRIIDIILISTVFDSADFSKGVTFTALDITDRKQAEQRLLEHRTQLKSLASELSLAEERERRRVAIELHDRIGQSLVISKMKLQTLCKSLSSSEHADALKEVYNCLGQVIQDTRTLTFDLSYPILYELGFKEAVSEWLEEQIRRKHGIETEFEDDGQTKPLDENISVLLFRDVRELLINVVKHANADKVKVSIRRTGDDIQVCVEDNGVGFNADEIALLPTGNGGFGLFSIRERLEQIGGLIEIESKQGRGSKITMTAPIKHESITDGARL